MSALRQHLPEPYAKKPTLRKPLHYDIYCIMLSFKTISHSKPNLIYVSQLDNAIHNNKIKHMIN